MEIGRAAPGGAGGGVAPARPGARWERGAGPRRPLVSRICVPGMSRRRFPARGYCRNHIRGPFVTMAAPLRDPPTETMSERRAAFVRVAFPAPAPASAKPASTLPGVALVTLDRPEALNALSFDLLDQLAAALEALDADASCRAIVITGSGTRAFAAGADIRELAPQTYASLRDGRRFEVWDRLAAVGLPMIAAVRGFALGGGCELAMACDMIVAAEDATFGQPEIRLGVMPGAGGTQRLTRAIGKARAMEMILTGESIDARAAELLGLVSRVVPAEATLDAALGLAARIASLPPLAIRAAKAAILAAYEPGLKAGLTGEREAFFRLFDTEDQTEGMAAFIEKRRRPGRVADHQGPRRTRGMEKDLGGSDVGRDIERDLGDAPPATLRDTRPTTSRRSTPAPRSAVMCRPRNPRVRSPNRPSTIGTAPRRSSSRRFGRSAPRAWSSSRSIATRWPAMRRRATRSPSSTRVLPDYPVVYTMDAGGFDIVVNGDHLLSWGIEASAIQDAAMRKPGSLVRRRRLDRRDVRRAAPAQLPDRRRLGCRPNPPAGGHPASGRRAGVDRASPCRDTGAPPADRRFAAARRRRLRRPVRRLHRRAFRAERTSRSTDACSSWSTAVSSSSSGQTPRPDGGDRTSPSFTTIRLEVADAIATITLDRPDALNALTVTMKQELLAAFRTVARDRAVRAVILTGAGGRSVPARTSRSGSSRTPRRSPSRSASATTRSSGRCARWTSRSSGRSTASRRAPAPPSRSPATSGWPPRARASCPGVRADRPGTRQRRDLVPAAAGRTGQGGRARPARRDAVGGGCRAVRPGRAGGARRCARGRGPPAGRRLAELAPRALALTKRALERSWSVDLDAALEDEAYRQGIAGATQDHAEGLAAFVEKRPPRFTGE